MILSMIKYEHRRPATKRQCISINIIKEMLGQRNKSAPYGTRPQSDCRGGGSKTPPVFQVDDKSRLDFQSKIKLNVIYSFSLCDYLHRIQRST